MERKPIVLSKNNIALIQIFHKSDEMLDVSIGAMDRFIEHEAVEDAAKQFVFQLKDAWTPRFMRALKKEIANALSPPPKNGAAHAYVSQKGGNMSHVLEMKYFILKPKAKDGYDMFARASQDAMLAYSNRIRTEAPLFAEQLMCWATKEKTSQDELYRVANKKIQPTKKSG